ncbi:DUF6562 domain-containing protein [Bacteroides uniformis]|uniref:DUF6562 domain-containing protein n=1 Tax=Bacteroides uniformis TaxID=820 RepID=UPI0039B608DA
MKKILYLIICMPLLLFSACDVHEWPETPEFVKMHLRLNYETDMTEWEHLYDGTSVIEQGLGDTYDNHQDYGKIRYIVRTYPVSEKQRTMQDYVQEFVFTKDIAEGYDHEVTLDLLPGNYNVMVWSDLVQTSGDNHFHNADNFAEIMLQGDHKGNTNHRDAFRGTNNISLVADIMEHLPDTLDIAMQRPLAKFEFLTTDLKEFVNKEFEYLQKEAATRGEVPPTRVNTDDYKVVFYYSGFMPNTYNMNTDKPVDSKMGVLFESKLEILSENEASLGFDYVFVNGKKSAVTVQIGLYDKEDRQLALSDPINVPLQRNHHTMLKGSFLMSQASGGITINPDFDGNHNILIE